MSFRAGRILVTAFMIEALAIGGLVLLVALLGPSDPDSSRAFAAQVGYWFGPSAGFALCIAGGWFVARGLAARQVLAGLVLGAAVAVIDVALLVAGGAAFDPVFVASNTGKLLAGTIGGWLASRGVRRAADG